MNPLILPVLVAVRDEVNTRLLQAERPVCRMPLVWKSTYPPADACDCRCEGGGHGQGWVRFVGANSVTLARGNTCVSMLDVVVEAGIYRCAPTPGDGETTIPAAVEEQHTLDMLVDTEAMRRGVRCSSWFKDKDLDQPAIQAIQTIGPSGGCTGVVVVGVVRLDGTGCGNGAM